MSTIYVIIQEFELLKSHTIECMAFTHQENPLSAHFTLAETTFE